MTAFGESAATDQSTAYVGYAGFATVPASALNVGLSSWSEQKEMCKPT